MKVCGRGTRQESPDLVIGWIKHHMETLAFCCGNFWNTLEKKKSNVGTLIEIFV
jgi:hypothetical protein